MRKQKGEICGRTHNQTRSKAKFRQFGQFETTG